MKAIETHYAGCHFRSRLEARWAVFFDSLGISWEYEAQGYEVGADNVGSVHRRYLPDFWLPSENVHAEVKGSSDGIDWDLITAVVIPHGGCIPGRGLLLLGPIPRGDRFWMHLLLGFHKGDIYAHDVTFRNRKVIQEMEGHICGNDATWTIELDAPFEGYELSTPNIDLRTSAAYRAARSARFEHGESGATSSQVGSPITDRPRRGGRALRGPFPWRPEGSA